MTDLNIVYSGGSGGFLLLHLLLLSEKYHVCFDKNKTFNQAFDQQWKINGLHNWKRNETWPDNKKTFESISSLCKIYFVCNPINIENLNHYPGKTLVIYTDYYSQLLLAYYKKANWYCNTVSISDSTVPIDLKLTELLSDYLLTTWNRYYHDVKEESWPDCNSFNNIQNLPLYIQDELFANEYTFISQRLPLANYKDHDVDKAIMPILNLADYTIRLQDLVNSNGSILTEILSTPAMNSKQLTFLQTWKQLHPPELLSKIGIDL